jgi:methionyl-tRNA formyltransferase
MGDMEKRVVFMGSPDFALPTLKALNRDFEVVGVVTQPDRPAGRGRTKQPPDVKLLAEDLCLPLIQPDSLRANEAMAQVKAWAPDVIVVAAFGQILQEYVLNLPPFGCVNVHASLLPRWRGAAPVQAAILHDEVTGITIMKMDEGLDTGPILSQRRLPIANQVTAGALFDILAQMGADLLMETLPKYLGGKIQPRPQENKLATYAPRLKKADGKLDFSQSADTLSRKIRAYHPWPGSFQYFHDIRLKIIAAHARDAKNVIPGKRYIVDQKPAWGTGEGLLVLDQVQLAGKTCVSGEAFLRGAKNWINEKECK